MTIKDAIQFFDDTIITGNHWADLGCGSGTFTQALAAKVVPGAIIYAIDKDQDALERIPKNTGNARIVTVPGDMQDMEIIPGNLDGILLANSLHYVNDKKTFFDRIFQRLDKTPSVLLVEYDRVTSNPWVPYPLAYDEAVAFFKALGYWSHKLLHRRRSSYSNVDLYSIIFNVKSSN